MINSTLIKRSRINDQINESISGVLINDFLIKWKGYFMKSLIKYTRMYRIIHPRIRIQNLCD